MGRTSRTKPATSFPLLFTSNGDVGDYTITASFRDGAWVGDLFVPAVAAPAAVEIAAAPVTFSCTVLPEYSGVPAAAIPCLEAVEFFRRDPALGCNPERSIPQ